MKHTPITPLALTDQSASDPSVSHQTPAHPGRHDGWTPERQAAFLKALASTHSVAQAAREVGLSRQSAYALRARLKGEPFDHAWHAALYCRFDALAEAALERALHGVEVPHFYQGELIHTSRKFDERLTVALLAMRERFEPTRPYGSHPSKDYGPQDFGPLLDRVESGPETWEEGLREEYARLREEYAAQYDEDDEDFDDEYDDGLPEGEDGI